MYKIYDILDFSESLKSKLVPKISLFNLKDVIDEMYSIVRFQVE